MRYNLEKLKVQILASSFTSAATILLPKEFMEEETKGPPVHSTSMAFTFDDLWGSILVGSNKGHRSGSCWLDYKFRQHGNLLPWCLGPWFSSGDDFIRVGETAHLKERSKSESIMCPSS